MEFELRLLRCALALAEQRNFARAAREMHISQPSLSRVIQKLEAQVGSRLFDRTRVGVDPTDTGALFLKHAREVISRTNDLSREMNLLRGLEGGELRIGAGTYPSHMYVDRALARLIRRHPTVHINVANDNWANLLPLLRKRELDVAVIDIRSAESDSELHTIKLSNHQAYYAMRAGHPLLRKEQDKPQSSLWKYPFVTTARIPPELLRGLSETLLGPRDAALQNTKALLSVACESLPMMKTIAMNSNAIAILPWRLIAKEVHSGKMAAIAAPPWVRGDFGIVRLAHRSLSPLGEAFVRLVQEADAELLEWEKKNRPI